jgi:hypothetical protein
VLGCCSWVHLPGQAFFSLWIFSEEFVLEFNISISDYFQPAVNFSLAIISIEYHCNLEMKAQRDIAVSHSRIQKFVGPAQRYISKSEIMNTAPVWVLISQAAQAVRGRYSSAPGASMPEK